MEVILVVGFFLIILALWLVKVLIKFLFQNVVTPVARVASEVGTVAAKGLADAGVSVAAAVAAEHDRAHGTKHAEKIRAQREKAKEIGGAIGGLVTGGVVLAGAAVAVRGLVGEVAAGLDINADGGGPDVAGAKVPIDETGAQAMMDPVPPASGADTTDTAFTALDLDSRQLHAAGVNPQGMGPSAAVAHGGSFEASIPAESVALDTANGASRLDNDMDNDLVPDRIAGQPIDLDGDNDLVPDRIGPQQIDNDMDNDLTVDRLGDVRVDNDMDNDLTVDRVGDLRVDNDMDNDLVPDRIGNQQLDNDMDNDGTPDMKPGRPPRGRA